MSKLQFISLLSPAVGSFVLVLLAWMQSNSRLADLKENMNQRFAEVNQRFAQVDQRFERVDKQFDRMDAQLLRIENDQREFYGITRKLEGRVDELSKK
jgi:septal ring factor EnvC (AmiA/AmiB activator)